MKLNPLVKWAGGKRQLIDKLIALKPREYGRYYEPFVGGAALLLELAPKQAIINDSNKDLITIYRCLRNIKSFEKMFALCKKHEKNHSKDYFYQIRDMDRKGSYSSLPSYVKAARVLYLNKACFNGLYRVNSEGFFNVPFNGKEVVHCFDDENIRAVHEYFRKNKPIILCKDFAVAVKTARPGDFVYFDPPYDVVGAQSFTSYTKNGFGKDEQKRLSDVFIDLTERGVYIMLSNANTEFIRNLYQGFHINIVDARRIINSKADGRGTVQEVIITNY